MGRESNSGSMRLRGSRAVHLDSIEAFALAVVVYCIASRSYTIAVSGANCNRHTRKIRFT
jgi:hypothetical protein